MKFVRSRYPFEDGVPCWTLSGKYLWIDVDWNPRFPFGACFGVSLGPENSKKIRTFRSCLDLNAPLGEPNRLYLNTRRREVVLGLGPGQGCSRYRYHRDADGRWTRDAKPAPGHWGWLTIDRHRD